MTRGRALCCCQWLQLCSHQWVTDHFHTHQVFLLQVDPVMLRDAASVQNEQLEQLEGSLCCLLGKSLLVAWMPWVIYPIVQTY